MILRKREERRNGETGCIHAGASARHGRRRAGGGRPASRGCARAVEQYGGISAVQELCRRGQVSDGFDRLAGLGKLALSAEALAVSAKFNACFTDDEVNHCFAQLCAANYFGKARF